MANSCCQESYTECNKLVTVAYLKSFVGNDIQNTTDGSAMGVNSSDENYCPTYGELVGGTLVQNHEAAEGGKWSDDVDGIIVGGSYSDNQCVKQEDLSLVYTRFKSLTSSASSETFLTCGDSATLSYTYTLTRTKKEMNGNCTVDTTNTDGNDTNAEKITNTSSNSAFSVTKTSVSAGKNGPTSTCPATASSRSTTVTTKVTFRGTEHSATPITITQNALTGGYTNFVRSYDTVTSVTATAGGSTDFGCEGGTGTASGTEYYDTYNVYSWVDSCGTNYPSCTTTSYAGSGSNSLGSKSVTFGVIDPCEEESDYHDYEYITFSSGGYSDSVRFDQYCYYDPDECTPPCDDSCYESEPYDSWDYETSQNLGTISCSGGTFTVDDEVSTYGEIYRSSGTSGDCQDCPDKIVSHSYTAYGGTVEIECNNTSSRKYFSGTVPGGSRKYHGYLAAGPCCPDCECEPTYTQSSTHRNIAASGATVTVTWRKTYPDCSNPACTSGNVTEEVSVPCNSGAARTYTGTSVNGYGTWTVTQRSGTTATCGSMCECYSATTATGEAESYSSTTCYATYTLSKRDANGNWTVVDDGATVLASFDENTGSTEVTRTGTATVSEYSKCDGNCDSPLVVSWTVSVPGKSTTCFCSGITIEASDGVNNVPASGTSTGRIIGYFTKDACLSLNSTSSTVNWVTNVHLDYTEGSSTEGLVVANFSENGSTSARDFSTTLTFTGASDGPCEITISGTQNGAEQACTFKLYTNVKSGTIIWSDAETGEEVGRSIVDENGYTFFGGETSSTTLIAEMADGKSGDYKFTSAATVNCNGTGTLEGVRYRYTDISFYMSISPDYGAGTATSFRYRDGTAPDGFTITYGGWGSFYTTAVEVEENNSYVLDVNFEGILDTSADHTVYIKFDSTGVVDSDFTQTSTQVINNYSAGDLTIESPSLGITITIRARFDTL